MVTGKLWNSHQGKCGHRWCRGILLRQNDIVELNTASAYSGCRHYFSGLSPSSLIDKSRLPVKTNTEELFLGFLSFVLVLYQIQSWSASDQPNVNILSEKESRNWHFAMI
jgi:hypothetical protein